MFKVKSELINADKPPRLLLRLNEKIKDWRPFWVGFFIPRYLTQVQQNFETEGELVPAGWPDLKPTYAAWKARHFPGTKILQRQRRLRNSLMPGATGRDTVLQVRPLEAKVGTNVPYAKYVNARRKIMPRVTVKEYSPMIREYLKRVTQEAKDGR